MLRLWDARTRLLSEGKEEPASCGTATARMLHISVSKGLVAYLQLRQSCIQLYGVRALMVALQFRDIPECSAAQQRGPYQLYVCLRALLRVAMSHLHVGQPFPGWHFA